MITEEELAGLLPKQTWLTWKRVWPRMVVKQMTIKATGRELSCELDGWRLRLSWDGEPDYRVYPDFEGYDLEMHLVVNQEDSGRKVGWADFRQRYGEQEGMEIYGRLAGLLMESYKIQGQLRSWVGIKFPTESDSDRRERMVSQRQVDDELCEWLTRQLSSAGREL